MSTSIDDLALGTRDKAWTFIGALKLKKIPFVVTSTLRTAEEQAAYYAQGRRPLATVNELRVQAGLHPILAGENGYTITNCDGVTILSNHQGGHALDVVPMNAKGFPEWPKPTDPRWQLIAAEAEAAGFKWGGRWVSFPDLPHYEDT